MPEGESVISAHAAVKPAGAQLENQLPLSEAELIQIARDANSFILNHPPVVIRERIGSFDAEVASPYTPRALMDNRRSLPVDIGKRFDAHGICKGNNLSQLKALVRLLALGIDMDRELHTAPLRLSDEDEIGLSSAVGAAGPYENGNFILLGNPDSSVREKGIRAVLVEEPFYSSIPKLQQKFPHILFIPANETLDQLSKLVAS